MIATLPLARHTSALIALAAPGGVRVPGGDEDVAMIAPGALGWRSDLFGMLVVIAVLWWFFRRGRGGAGGWGSYYLFWLAAPMAVALISAHPGFLVLVVLGVALRRWLPDPYLAIKYARRMRSLRIDIDLNPTNSTARRDLARIYLEKHRPRKALPLLEEALRRDPDSTELRYLLGLAQLGAGLAERAVESFVAVVHSDGKFSRGDPYLRAADGLIALGRFDDAEDALERFNAINGSSVEGCYKVAVVRARKGDRPGAKVARRTARARYAQLPAFQRRRQLGWYLRALLP